MSLMRKLRPDRNIGGALIPLSMLPIFGMVTWVFGINAGIYTVCIFAWIYSLYPLVVFLRTRNAPHLLVCAYAAFAGLIFYQLRGFVLTGQQPLIEFRIAYIVGFLFFGALLIYLAVTRKIIWRGRDIYELAAETVEEVGDGYNDRPRPVGKVDFSPHEILSFAHFAARHLIALTSIGSKNILFVPVKMGEEFGRVLGLSGDLRDATWVNFDFDGNISVHISQKDYLDYRDALAFDVLCQSLGQVFIDFAELHKKGEGVRIINRMDDLKIGFLS